MSEASSTRRKPPLPKPGNNPPTTTGGGASALSGLQANAPAFVPSWGNNTSNNNNNNNSGSTNGSSSTTTTPSSLASKSLNVGAASFQPKFSSNSSNSNNNNNANVEPTPESIKTATAGINSSHAKTIASKSKMSATATGFTPTRSDGGSFPSSPEKNTPSSLMPTNNNNGSGSKVPPPPQLPSSPPSGVKKATTNPTPSTNQQQQQQGTPSSAPSSGPTSPNSRGPTMIVSYPDPFKNSKLAFSEEGKKKFGDGPQNGYAHPAPQKDPMGLNSSWTMHCLDQSSRFAGAFGGASSDAVQQQQTITKLTQIADVEGFWRLLRSIPAPASRAPKFTYYFFRKTIFPSWEEPRNKHGGTFQFSVCDSARGNTDKDLANDVWHLILMGLIGEAFAESSVINGVSFKVRKSMSIEFWTNNCSSKQIGAFLNSVKDTIKQRFGEINPFTKMRLLDGLEFTSNETNAYKANPPPPPPPPVPTVGSNSPHGKGGNSKKNQQQQQQQQQHQQGPPSTANDFRL